jgi:CheY-like chemotaxis protein
MTILIVDDNAIDRILLTKIVSHAFNCGVISAENGQGAVEAITKSRPDLILLDLAMPKISGTEFLQILRSREEWKNIPVVVITSEAERETVQLIARLGVSGFLLKPYVAEDVVKLVSGALKTSKPVSGS